MYNTTFNTLLGGNCPCLDTDTNTGINQLKPGHDVRYLVRKSMHSILVVSVLVTGNPPPQRSYFLAESTACLYFIWIFF